MSDDLLTRFFEEHPMPESSAEERERSRKGREMHVQLLKMQEQNSIVRIWCDGRVKVNPGVAGWAALLDYNGTRKLVHGHSEGEILTNNQAQIEAVIFALEQLKKSCTVVIVSDSQYVVNIGNWQWEPKSNFEHWQRFEHAVEPHEVTLVWQKELTSEEQRIVRTKAESYFTKVTS